MRGPKISSLIKLSILLLLNEGKNYGYDIIKKIEKTTGKKVSAGEIYPFLKNLKKYNLVAAEKSGPREKTLYQLTKKGRLFVNNILSRFESIIDTAVKSKISTCAHCGCKIYEGAFVKKLGRAKKTFCCIYCANNY